MQFGPRWDHHQPLGRSDDGAHNGDGGDGGDGGDDDDADDDEGKDDDDDDERWCNMGRDGINRSALDGGQTAASSQPLSSATLKLLSSNLKLSTLKPPQMHYFSDQCTTQHWTALQRRMHCTARQCTAELEHYYSMCIRS